MKWQVKTQAGSHTVKTNSSKTAVEKVRETDQTEIVLVRLLPSTFAGKAKRLMKQVFGRQGK